MSKADEFFFVADEFLARTRAAGIAGTYQQLSVCAGVFRLQVA